MPSRKRAVFAFNFSINSPVSVSMSNASQAAAAMGGGMVLLNRYGRERLRRSATISLLADVNPPAAPPSALPSVEVVMSMRPWTPWCSAVPLPVGPTKPDACESSTMTIASYLSARSQICGSGATVPSMLNTPSVAIRTRRAPPSRASLSFASRSSHVGVLVAEARSLAEADAVDDRCVVERVGNDGVLLGEDRLEQAAVRIPTGNVEDRVFVAEELRDAILQVLVDVLRAADKAHRTHAVAVLVERLVCRGDHAGVAGKAEVVVGAEVEDFAAVLHADGGALRRDDHALVLVEPGFPDSVEFVLEIGADAVGVHGWIFSEGGAGSKIASGTMVPAAVAPDATRRVELVFRNAPHVSVRERDQVVAVVRFAFP